MQLCDEQTDLRLIVKMSNIFDWFWSVETINLIVVYYHVTDYVIWLFVNDKKHGNKQLRWGERLNCQWQID